MLSTAPTLHIIDAADANAKLEVHTDASAYPIGAVLYQSVNGKLKPIVFHLCKLKEAKIRNGPTE